MWIDNLAAISIGNNCCVSQGAYHCTGNHDWSVKSSDLITRPIHIEVEAWLGAKSVVGPGVTVHRGAVLSLEGVATNDLQKGWIYVGNPAVAIGRRKAQRP